MILIADVVETVREYYGIESAAFFGPVRRRALARPRQVAMYLCRQLTTKSTTIIGHRIGGRDHSTVTHGVQRITHLIAAAPAFREEISYIGRLVLSREAARATARASAEAPLAL